MTRFFERYQQGFCQEVYEELLDMGESVFQNNIYEDAFIVAQEIMRRIRYNIEQLLLPRLQSLTYRFGDGSWDHADHLPEADLLVIQQEEPPFQPASRDISSQLLTLENGVGTIPLSLYCWYKEVGSVNFIGSFHESQFAYSREKKYKSGYGLDPLFTQPLQDVIEEMRDFEEDEDEEGKRRLPISPDNDLKYGYSGGGDYELVVPCRAFDGILEGEPHHITFVNYLRLCLRWGGFPGLEKENRLAPGILDYLTKDLLPF